MKVGDRIKQRRLKLEISADELADKIGKSRATVYRYENGDIENMPTTVLEPIADALNTTPAYLMGWEDDPDDWESIANSEGIAPPNDYEGTPESWYSAKINAEKNYYNEEAAYVKFALNDFQFRSHAETYRLLNKPNRDKADHYTENLLNIQRLENDQEHFLLNAAHERTDIPVTEEMKQHDDNIMDDENF